MKPAELRRRQTVERIMGDGDQRNMVAAVTYYWMFTNDLLCACVIDAIADLRRTPLYRQRVKQLLRRLDHERDRYEREMNRVCSDRSDFFADANESVAAAVSHDIDMLYYALKQAYDTHRVPHSAAVARLQLAYGLAAYACSSFDDDWVELRRLSPLFRHIAMDALRPTAMLALLGQVDEELRLPPAVMEDPRVRKAIRTAVLAFNARLRDPQTLARAIGHTEEADDEADDDGKEEKS